MPSNVFKSNKFSEEQSEKLEFIPSLQDQGMGYGCIAKVLSKRKVCELTKGLYGAEIMSMQFSKDKKKD